MSAIIAATTNRWPEILQQAGVDPRLLDGKHHECPVCGGTDRFRFDDKDGRGTFVCQHCQPKGAGNGFSLLQGVLHTDFKGAAEFVEKLLGIENAPPERIPMDTPEQAVAAWPRLLPAAGHPYLSRKGIKSHCARIHGRDLIIPVQSDLQGTLVSVQKILPAKTADGKDKFFVKGTKKTGNFCLLGNAAPDQPLLFAEGFATAASLHEATGLPVVVCFDCGNIDHVLKKLRAEWRKTDFIVCGDSEPPETAEKARKFAKKYSARVIIPDFTGYAAGSDFNDLASVAGLAEVARQVAPPAAPWEEPEAHPAPAITKKPNGNDYPVPTIDNPPPDRSHEDEEKAKTGGNAATAIVELAEAMGILLWHTPGGSAWASVPVRDHLEHCEIKGLSKRLSHAYYRQNGGVAQKKMLDDALSILEAKALFDGPAYPVYTRIAGHNGNIYYDIGNEDWDVVKITPAGWSIISSLEAPVHFNRTGGMLPLPMPDRLRAANGKADLAAAMAFDVADPEADLAFKLIVGWLLGCLNPDGAYPILYLTGLQGSGKSERLKFLRRLLDPNEAGIRTLPPSSRDLFVSATNAHMLAYDNVSEISHGMSDDLCVVATGGSYGVRRLHSDSGEMLLRAHNPIALNGIGVAALRDDLMQRMLLVTLPAIHKYIPAKQIEAAQNVLMPGILAWLFDITAAGLKAKPTVQCGDLPRMADFFEWIHACEAAVGWKPGEYIKAYGLSRREQTGQLMENNIVAAAVRVLMMKNEDVIYEETAGDLLKILTEAAYPNGERTPKGWPDKPQMLSNQLLRLQPAFELENIHVRRNPTKREGHNYWIVSLKKNIEKKQASPASPASPAPLESKTCAGEAKSQASPASPKPPQASPAEVQAAVLEILQGGHTETLETLTQVVFYSPGEIALAVAELEKRGAVVIHNEAIFLAGQSKK